MLDKSKRIIIYGDQHLCSKNYGCHIDYPGLSLKHFKLIGDLAEQESCGVIAGLGDLTYGRFNNLTYRLAVEMEFERHLKITNGNRYEVKGNHDKMTDGASEYDFYKAKGMFSCPDHFDLGCVRFHIVNYGEENRQLNIDPNKYNFVLGHNLFRYKSNILPNYGTGVELDNYTTWKDVDMIVAGHIHQTHKLSGFMLVDRDGDSRTKEIPVYQLGCPNTPAYQKEGLDEVGTYLIVDCSGDEPKLEIMEFPLPELHEKFVIPDENEVAKVLKEHKVDVSDVVKELASHDSYMADPELLIDSLNVFSKAARDKAKELYRNALG